MHAAWSKMKPAFCEMCVDVAGASIPRNYHSISLLLPDARIFNGGAGLCGVGCACASLILHPQTSPRPCAGVTTS